MGIFVEGYLAKLLNIEIDKEPIDPGKYMVSKKQNEIDYCLAKCGTKIKSIDFTMADSLLSLNLDSELDEYAKFMDTENINYQDELIYPIFADRSELLSCNVIGISDIATTNNVYEIKHSIDKDDLGIKQSIIYSHMLNQRICSPRNSYCINTLTGKIHKTELSCSIDYYNRYVRAIIALRIARSNRISIAELPLGVVLFLDTEYIYSHETKRQEVREVGIIAVDMDNYTVLDIHQSLHGCEPGYDGTGFSLLTGLKPNNMPIDLTKVDEFMNKYTGCPVVVWGYPDDKILTDYDSFKTTINNTIDLSREYLGLISKSYDRDSCVIKLECAWNELSMTDFIWKPHRAFEDSLATMMIYASLAKGL